jgi:hypothetical protein
VIWNVDGELTSSTPLSSASVVRALTFALTCSVPPTMRVVPVPLMPPPVAVKVPPKKSSSAVPVVVSVPPVIEPPPAMISDCPLTSELTVPAMTFSAGWITVPETPPVFLIVPELLIVLARPLSMKRSPRISNVAPTLLLNAAPLTSSK